MVIEDGFDVAVTVAKIVDNPSNDLLNLIIGKPTDTLKQMACAIFVCWQERSRNHPAVVTDKPDRQTLDGKRRALVHRSITGVNTAWWR